MQLPQKQEIKVEPGDKMSIVVKSKDPMLSELFNLPITTNRMGSNEGVYAAEGMSTYTVGPEGTIDFPVIGEIKVEGMTRLEVAGFIKGELMGRNLVKDPVVTVELVNATYSVLGEVNRPGRFWMDHDNLNILQAITIAGDLNIQGRRENIKLMREEADGLHTYNLDMTNMQELTKSPAFYLKQGDIIYVEPNDVRKRQTTVNGNNVLSWSFWISAASLLTSIAVLIAK